MAASSQSESDSYIDDANPELTQVQTEKTPPRNTTSYKVQTADENEALVKQQKINRQLKSLKRSVRISEMINKHFKTDIDSIPDSFAIFGITSDLETLLLFSTTAILAVIEHDFDHDNDEICQLSKQVENNIMAAAGRAHSYLQRLKRVAYKIPSDQFTNVSANQ